jgi:hypothetical protein
VGQGEKRDPISKIPNTQKKGLVEWLKVAEAGGSQAHSWPELYREFQARLGCLERTCHKKKRRKEKEKEREGGRKKEIT